MIGPTADLAIGYQVGSHFFFGAVVGYGGEYHDHYYYHYYEDEAYSLVPLMADVRWYIINHKNTFVVDVQGGVDLNHGTDFIVRANAGFAFGNWEALAGVQLYEPRPIVSLNLNVAYRFGNVIKKWW